MNDQTTTAEKIYVAMENVCRGAGYIRDAHGGGLFLKQHWPPGGGSPCMVPAYTIPHGEIYEALLDLQDSLQILIEEYAAFYHIDPKSLDSRKKR